MLKALNRQSSKLQYVTWNISLYHIWYILQRCREICLTINCAICCRFCFELQWFNISYCPNVDIHKSGDKLCADRCVTMIFFVPEGAKIQQLLLSFTTVSRFAWLPNLLFNNYLETKISINVHTLYWFFTEQSIKRKLKSYCKSFVLKKAAWPRGKSHFDFMSLTYQHSRFNVLKKKHYFLLIFCNGMAIISPFRK